MDLKTIEVFPHATRRILFPSLEGKKQWSMYRRELQKSLEKIGVIFPDCNRVYSDDELDAVLAALTNLLSFQERTEILGDELDGYIEIPQGEVSFL